MKRSVPAHRTGLAEWKVEIGDGVQDFLSEALFPKWSFSCPSGRRARNAGEWAERIMKTDYPFKVGSKAD